MSAITTAPQPTPVSPLRGLLIRHSLVSFFVLAYALAWLAWSPWYLSRKLRQIAEPVAQKLN